ncbi:MAG: hypothetical protein JXR37_32635 [Kiritimatiellae bacterium]|nr:hypothetical protein [Kiritimatiellia bacterium]
MQRVRRLIRRLDILALAGMAGGIGLIIQPWWAGGFRVGFFATLLFTVLHIVTSHVNGSEAS